MNRCMPMLFLCESRGFLARQQVRTCKTVVAQENANEHIFFSPFAGIAHLPVDCTEKGV